MNETAEKEISRMCDEYPDAYPDLLRAAMVFAYRHAASMCAYHTGAMCESEGDGSVSHIVACRFLQKQIQDLS